MAAAQRWNIARRSEFRPALIAAAALIAGGCTAGDGAPDAGPSGPAVRCAVVGGLVDSGLWQEICRRFQDETGTPVQITATGPKHVVVEPFRVGDADVIAMHSCDAMLNLAADGKGIDPQPWARNDMILVGPKSDPAKIQGMKNAAAALGKIIDAKATFLVHQSQGAGEVLHDLLDAAGLELDPDHTISLPTDRHRRMLQKAAEAEAYTIVGRIPFLSGKVKTGGMTIMVQGDPRLRRPYLVLVGANNLPGSPRRVAAERLASFLREPQTQAWIAEYGKGRFDQQPLFFSVVVEPTAAGDDRR